MFSRFFIDRPIFATVMSILITLGGGVAILHLPLAQYPSVTPPTVQVDCNYPGASAQVVAETVASPIEQQVNGVENMLYMSSQCTNDGSYNLTVTFKQGVNLNMAQVLVQNRVNLALPMLPEVIKATGVTTRKRSPDILMAVNLNSPDGRYDQLYLSNYAVLHVRDELARLPGISDLFISGQRDYSMRIWVDPEKLASRNLTANDVVAAVREQNAQVACGQIGQQPAKPGQQTQITLTTLGRLSEPEQFADIVLRAAKDGRITRIRDVGRVELAAKNRDVLCRLDGKESVALIVFQLPDANALELADRIHAKMEELRKDFPEGVSYEIQYDTTPYTRECIREVVKSLRDAVILVALVVLVFLQKWRSAIIPLVAVPVAIIGTFGVMMMLGFSLNNLTMFGMVLAIGIVVDDAIVVVEAVEHQIEIGLAPREATLKAMDLVASPVVTTGLVLSAVFVPCAFVSGIVGQFFRQFALTIAASTIISMFNSLTLSPALCALLLRRKGHGGSEILPRVVHMAAGAWIGSRVLAHWPEIPLWAAILAGAVAGGVFGPVVNVLLGLFFRLFNACFGLASRTYLCTVRMALRVSILVLVVYGGLLAMTGSLFVKTPKGFIPQQDMGYLMVNIQLPDAAAYERTKDVVTQLQTSFIKHPGVAHTMGVAGTSFFVGANAPYFGSMFVILKDFSERRDPALYSEKIADDLQKMAARAAPEAMVTVMPPTPVRGVGRAGGFKFMLEDRNEVGLPTLQQQAELLVRKASELRNPRGMPRLVRMMSVFRANSPILFADVNRKQCMTMGVPLGDAFDTLQVYLGSRYVNDFNRFGRTWQVIVQADAPFRNQVDGVKRLKVRNSRGDMVPIGAMADIRPINGPLILTRYNMHAAAAINGSTGPGVSSSQGIEIMQDLAAAELVPGLNYEWSEMAFLELQGRYTEISLFGLGTVKVETSLLLFGLAAVSVFLVLAAQYESWSLPLAVILVVPMCLLSAIAGVIFRAMDINIFTQVGFVVLVGLASKNAILIVQFAKQTREEGASRRDAALAACSLRLRPIVMTSFAFILGVSPLLTARGAGAEMRQTLGTAVFSGMVGVTLFGLLLTPVFFCTVDWISGAAIFRSRLFRWFHTLTLGFFALGFVWMGFRLAGKLVKRAVRKAREANSSDDSDLPN